MYYPKEFQKDKKEYDYNNTLKGLLSLEFAKLAGEQIEEEAIDSKERELLGVYEVNSWNIHKVGNMEIQMETEFYKFMIAIGEHTKERLEEITVFKFYALLGYIKEKNKAK